MPFHEFSDVHVMTCPWTNWIGEEDHAYQSLLPTPCLLKSSADMYFSNICTVISSARLIVRRAREPSGVEVSGGIITRWGALERPLRAGTDVYVPRQLHKLASRASRPGDTRRLRNERRPELTQYSYQLAGRAQHACVARPVAACSAGL